MNSVRIWCPAETKQMGVVTIFPEEGKRGKGEEGSSDSAREGGNKERRAGWAGLGGSRLKGRRVGGWERERLAGGEETDPEVKETDRTPSPAT